MYSGVMVCGVRYSPEVQQVMVVCIVSSLSLMKVYEFLWYGWWTSLGDWLTRPRLDFPHLWLGTGTGTRA